jgi:proteasome lid subunit RPN8/RPN11
VIDSIKSHALLEFPKESCGFILKNRGYLPLVNISTDPENYFKIKTSDYLSNLNNVLAVVHSHTKGTPVSSFDISSCNNTFLPWIIFIMPSNIEVIYPEKYKGEIIVL